MEHSADSAGEASKFGEPAPMKRRILAAVIDALLMGSLYTVVECGLLVVLCFGGAGGLITMLTQDPLNIPKMIGSFILAGAIECLTAVSPIINVWEVTQMGDLLQVNTVLGFINNTVGRLMALTFPLFAVNWLYHAIMECSAERGTLGKMVAGIAVTDKSGNRISMSRATVRHLAKSLSTLILGIGYIMALPDKTHRTLHDKLSGCLVVKTRP